jgi:hypothetical protein
MRYELEQLPPSRLCLEFIYRVNEYTEGKGLEFIPPKMIDCARSYIKSSSEPLTLHEGIINKILFP